MTKIVPTATSLEGWQPSFAGRSSSWRQKNQRRSDAYLLGKSDPKELYNPEAVFAIRVTKGQLRIVILQKTKIPIFSFPGTVFLFCAVLELRRKNHVTENENCLLWQHPSKKSKCEVQVVHSVNER